MTKPARHLPPLPKIAKATQRRIIVDMILGIDALFRESFESNHMHFGDILEHRPIYQRILVNHINGERSTAHKIAKDIGIPRGTVQRRLDFLEHIGWIENNGSHYWVSEKTARLPLMPRQAYRKATELIIKTAKQLEARKKF